ncbi:membrane protein [Capsulimonas corticalis]|uniref:Membrane protein n=1 Tax=Capsulimonas corticalis TaxID=2219043 RepID=A0A402CRT0_9BACT|nr:YkvA family protein [Capsulimonas corticalis]BDI28098.1 membrane protein [Capsulimonas corticalis]
MNLVTQLWKMFTVTRRAGGLRAASRMMADAPRYIKLMKGLLSDRRISPVAKTALLGAVVYAASPLDLIPDWIPVVGMMDDLGIVLMAINYFFGAVPPDVLDEHRTRAGLQPERVRVRERRN